MGNGPDQLDHELAVARATAHSGVPHLVTVSAPVVGADQPVAVARPHHEVEQAVLAAGLEHAFLRPYALRASLPPWLVDHLEEIQTLVLARPEHPTGTVTDVTGRPVRTIHGFLAENLDRFATPRGWRERLGTVALRAAAPRGNGPAAAAPRRHGLGAGRRR